jgi:ParB-like chromosome segregation protein Spo0J
VTLHNPDPIEIDPRPCGECGLAIDRHRQVDTPEGPEFFCVDLSPDEMTLPELERRADLRRQEEVAAILARWEALDVEIALRRGPLPLREPEPYRPAASTIDAFWWVVGLGDPERFKAWLAARPVDAPYLLKLLEGK